MGLYQRNGGNAVRRNGRPYAVGIMPTRRGAKKLALAVGYAGVTGAARRTEADRRRRWWTGDVKRLCSTVKTGGRIDAITCQVLDTRRETSHERTDQTHHGHARTAMEICRTAAYPLDRNHQRTFEALEVRDCIEHVTWGRWQITPLGETIAKHPRKGTRIMQVSFTAHTPAHSPSLHHPR